MRKAALLAVSIGVLSVGFCSSAGAAIVTVGSPLTSAFKGTSVSIPSATLVDFALESPTAHATSPVSGVIVRWNILDAKGGPYHLQVLRPAGGAKYTNVVSSPPATTPGPVAKDTIATDLPIQAGDTVGIELGPGTEELGVFETPKATVAAWVPAVPAGATVPYSVVEPGGEYGFNAEVQPAPTLTALSPARGSVKGGASVTITGTDLEGASAVSFGATAANSFTVTNEGEITAVAPASKTLAAAPVTVTTVAGTATSASTFTYQGCAIPKLGGKKLKAAKKALKKADCKLGKVKKVNGATSTTGKVKGQSPKVGKVLAPGSKVNVKLD